MAITLGSVSPTLVADDGGGVVTISGITGLVAGVCQVFLVTTAGDVACYSGISGAGNDIPVVLGQTSISFVMPPASILTADGAPYEVKVVQSPDEASITKAVDISNRNFFSTPHEMKQLMPPFLKTGPRRIAESDPLAIETARIFQLGGEVWSTQINAAATWHPGTDDTAIAAPTGVEDVVFGVEGADAVADWFGLLRTVNAGSFVQRAYVDRHQATGNVLVFFEIRDDDVDIVAANGSTLHTVSPQAGVASNCVAAMISADGNSLVWGAGAAGIKTYQFGTSPTPDAAASIQAFGMTMRDDDVLLSVTMDPKLVSATVLDADDGITKTGPSSLAAGVHVFQAVIHLLATTGVTQDAVLHAQTDSSQKLSWAFEVGGALNPGYSGGSPMINANGKWAYGSTHDGLTSSNPRLAFSGTPLTADDTAGGSDSHGGFYVSTLAAFDDPEWLIDLDRGDARGSIAAIDALDRVYWAIRNQSTFDWDRTPTPLGAPIDLLASNTYVLGRLANGDPNWTHRIEHSELWPQAFALSPDETDLLVSFRAGTTATATFAKGDAEEEAFTNVVADCTLFVASLKAATGVKNWVKMIRTFATDTGDTGSGGDLHAPKSLAINRVSNTVRIGCLVDFTAGKNRLIAGAGAGVGDVVYQNDTVAGDLEERLVHVVLDIATGVAQSIGQLVESTDLAIEVNDTFLDLRAG